MFPDLSIFENIVAERITLKFCFPGSRNHSEKIQKFKTFCFQVVINKPCRLEWVSVIIT
jgi:hypothetical protein